MTTIKIGKVYLVMLHGLSRITLVELVIKPWVQLLDTIKFFSDQLYGRIGLGIKLKIIQLLVAILKKIIPHIEYWLRARLQGRHTKLNSALTIPGSCFQQGLRLIETNHLNQMIIAHRSMLLFGGSLEMV